MPLALAFASDDANLMGRTRPMAPQKNIYTDGEDVVLEETRFRALSPSVLDIATEALGEVYSLWTSYNNNAVTIAFCEKGMVRSVDAGTTWFPMSLAAVDDLKPEHLANASIDQSNGRSDYIVINFSKGAFALHTAVESLTTNDAHSFALEDAYCLPHPETDEFLCADDDNGLMRRDSNGNFHTIQLDGMTSETLVRIDSAPGGFFVASFLSADRLHLATSKDLVEWNRAEFKGLTLDKDTIVSIVDVGEPTLALTIGVRDQLARDLWISDSSGMSFTKTLQHVAIVDGFVSIASSNDQVFANVLVGHHQNHRDVVARIITKVSKDGGRTWHPLKGNSESKKQNLHLHLVLPAIGGQRLSSEPVIAFGNTGDHLRAFSDAQLYAEKAGTWEVSNCTEQEAGNAICALFSQHRLSPDSVSDPAVKSVVKDGEFVVLPRANVPSTSPSTEVSLSAQADGKVSHAVQELNGRLANYLYLKSGDNRDEETVLVWSTNGELLISHDQGSEWQTFEKGDVEKVWSNPYFNDYVLVYTKNRELYASTNRAVSFQKVKLPGELSLFGIPFSFHPTQGSWMIVSVTPERCDSFDSCLPTAYATTNFGNNWKKLVEEITTCTFVVNTRAENSDSRIFCEQRMGSKFNVVSSIDWFKTVTVNVENSFGLAIDDEFVVTVAYDDEAQALLPFVSVDGRSFSGGRIPTSIKLDGKTGYTVIDTETKSVFLAVTSYKEHGQEMSELLKSGYFGTEYVSVLSDVNRDMIGLVDFERISSTEGVALANIVSNANEVRQRGERKIVKTKITHSDGAFWDFIPAPKGECKSQDTNDCSLHLHGYTERLDTRNKPSSPSAVGLIIGNGNAGEGLRSFHDASTYLSRDGGVTFKRINDHPSFWEYGDSGSLIVLADRGAPTDRIRYTQDEGETWEEYQFSESMVTVLNVANIPSDTSRKFLIFAQPPHSDGTNAVAIQVDLSGLTDRQCVYKGPDSSGGDFESWIPSHPRLRDECVLGHVAVYQRKIPSTKCYIGKTGKKLGAPKLTTKSCFCSREDYECDFGFKRTDTGACAAVSEPDDTPEMDRQCAVPGAIAWHHVTGYRKIAIDTCKGGQELDAGTQDRPCPGKEAEFEQRYGRNPGSGDSDDGGNNGGSGNGPSVFRIFISIIFVLGIVGTLAVVLVYKFKNQGRIYLGESEEPTTPLDKFAVIALSIAANAGHQFLRVWDAVLGQVDSRFRSSHINLYERIDNEERARILESDFEDEDLNYDVDNTELDGDNLHADPDSL